MTGAARKRDLENRGREALEHWNIMREEQDEPLPDGITREGEAQIPGHRNEELGAVSVQCQGSSWQDTSVLGNK